MRGALSPYLLLLGLLLTQAITGCAGNPPAADPDPAGLRTGDGPTPYGMLNVSVDYID